jgi:hypothetical protein
MQQNFSIRYPKGGTEMERGMSGRYALSLGLVLGGLIGVILGASLGDLNTEMILGAGLGLLIGLVIGALIEGFRRDKVEHRKPEDDVVRMIKMRVDTSTRVNLHPVVESIEGAATLNRSVFGLVPPGIAFLDGPPTDWPKNLAWKPRRYFGPFWEGSDLSQIEIFVQGPATIVWYYNDYFANCPDAPKYSPFYAGQNFPPNQKLTAVPATPGYIPDADGAGRFVCSLDRIAYSSRYGGTVELTFRAEYDVGLEVRFGGYLWDLKDMELRIYVAPPTDGFRDPPRAYDHGLVSCDILSNEQTCYSVPTPGNQENPAVPVQALDDVHEEELTQALVLLSQEIASRVAPDARRFVAGYLSSLFPELLAPDVIVDGIIITDDFIDPITRQGVPYVGVSYRARDVAATPTYWDNPKVEVTLEAWHVLNNELQGGPSKTFELKSDEDTSWMDAGQWSLENEIPYLDWIVIRVSGVELDTLNPNDVFETFEFRFELNQRELITAHNANHYGLIHDLTTSRITTDFVDDSSLHVHFNLDIRVYLVLR